MGSKIAFHDISNLLDSVNDNLVQVSSIVLERGLSVFKTRGDKLTTGLTALARRERNGVSSAVKVYFNWDANNNVSSAAIWLVYNS